MKKMNTKLAELVGCCKDCIHFELVLGRRPYCHRFVKRLEQIKERKHCYVFDITKDEVFQRLEAKGW